MRNRVAHFRELDRRHHIREVVRELPNALIKFSVLSLLALFSVILTVFFIGAATIMIADLWSQLWPHMGTIWPTLEAVALVFVASYTAGRLAKSFFQGLAEGWRGPRP